MTTTTTTNVSVTKENEPEPEPGIEPDETTEDPEQTVEKDTERIGEEDDDVVDENETEYEDPDTDTTVKQPFSSLHSLYKTRAWISWFHAISLILNAGLMVYAHVGLSAVILSNVDRIQGNSDSNSDSNSNNNDIENSNNNNNNTAEVSNNNSTTTNTIVNASDWVPTAACSLDDFSLWSAGGDADKPKQSNFCARDFDDQGTTGLGACLTNQECLATCFQQVWNYSAPCSACFAAVPSCSLASGCAFVCAQNSGQSVACEVCTEDCNVVFDACSGFQRPVREEQSSPTAAPTLGMAQPSIPNNNNNNEESTAEICARQQEGVDPEQVIEFIVVYELQFFKAIKTAWTSDARLLAVIVVVFSGFWPYAKNVLLAIAWFGPWSVARRDQILTWLRRLGKYTLVDIYVVILLMIGVLIQVNVANGVPVIIKAEPRPAIIAFLVATVWEFVQIEVMVHMHEKHCTEQDRKDKILRVVPRWYHRGVQGTQRQEQDEQEESPDDTVELTEETKANDKSIQQKSWSTGIAVAMALLFFTALGLYLAGSILETIRFTTILGGETRGCPRTYNLYEIGTELISDYFRFRNDALPGVWTLFFSYILFLVVFPLYCHLVHGLSFLFNFREPRMCKVADMCWTFASVEILALSVFTVEYKFDSFVAALAGEDGEDFFGIQAKLGPGFFVLIAYSVFAGLLHYFFNLRLLLDHI